MYHDEYIEFQNEMNMKFDTQRMKIERLESKQRVPIGSNFDHLRSQANENDKDPNACFNTFTVSLAFDSA